MIPTPGRIRILPDSLVDVIAAGEVVERPASVVKELLENALDAGGKNIRVSLLDGGRRQVQLADDGTGMDEENALLAIERHATSKISSLDDLSRLRTLGFRGEALPSIAAVGKFILETWDGESPSGTRIVIDGGRLIAVEPCGRARGTTVTLERIFGRLPARRKFLRTRETEQAWCLAAIEDAALAHPEVSFRATADGTELLNFPPASSLRERTASLWGVEAVKGLLILSHHREEIKVEGLISPPGQTYSRRWRHRVMVNGRPVRDPVLNRVIASALAGSWPSGRFPALVLSIAVPDEILDVNVHPAKSQVRFRGTGTLSEVLREAVRKVRPAQIPSSAPPCLSDPRPWNCEKPAVAMEPTLPFGTGRAPFNADLDPSPGAFPSSDAGAAGVSFRILGQVLGTYIILEGERGLEILDQHASHERIVFNRLMARRAGRPVPVQRLAVPLVLSLSASEAAGLAAASDLLHSFGFQIMEFGSGSLRVTAVPADLKGAMFEELLRELAGDPELGGHGPESVALAISRWACRQSVMAGRRLSQEEIRRLVFDLEEAESGFSCPHGRPTRVTLGRDDLERLFGRR